MLILPLTTTHSLTHSKLTHSLPLSLSKLLQYISIILLYPLCTMMLPLMKEVNRIGGIPNFKSNLCIPKDQTNLYCWRSYDYVCFVRRILNILCIFYIFRILLYTELDCLTMKMIPYITSTYLWILDSSVFSNHSLANQRQSTG